ncbi:GNAT family N-acetyltransferase, partial [Streptomyces sp. NPDC051130]
MTDRNPASAQRPHRHHWRRDVVELAALFCAVAVADGIANLVAHGPGGPALLVISAVALLVTAAFHTWWARRHSHAPPPGPAHPDPGGRAAARTAPTATTS